MAMLDKLGLEGKAEEAIIFDPEPVDADRLLSRGEWIYLLLLFLGGISSTTEKEIEYRRPYSG